MEQINLIRNELKNRADEKRAEILQRFFKTEKGQYGEGDVFLGVTVPDSRKIAKKHSGITLKELKSLLHSKIHEERLIALLILVNKFEEGSDKEKEDINKFYLENLEWVNNWDLVDLSAYKILGNYLLNKDKTPLYNLANSNNIWERRVAIIATFHFIKNNCFIDTLKISEILLNDEHDLIHKAVGWMLREIGKKSLKTEIVFLNKYYKVMPRTMLRYAIEKFPEELRLKYLTMKRKKDIIIYQSKTGKIEFKSDFKKDTIWASLNQIADLFDVKKPAISKHLKSIYKEGELIKKATVSILETVQKEGEREVVRKIEYYNLDAIISVGYRVNSKKATQFRVWATKTLKQHLLKGYTINKKQINRNYQGFMKAVSNVRALLPEDQKIKNEDILELVSAFAGTWFSLNAYDKEKFPKRIYSKKKIKITAEELRGVLQSFKEELKKKKQASDLFGQEREKEVIEGVIGSVFQSFSGKDIYPSLEEKASHLLYFIIKNHPFVDGNKRSAAFSFVWFLRKGGILRASITPEALTALTILIAESNPKDKDKMIKLVLLLIGKDKNS